MNQHHEQASQGRGTKRRSRRRGRVLGVAVLGLTPVVAIAWTGCSDDETNAFGPAIVDPGGTHGAEISISVIGRGRVTANLPGLDCPADCFAKYIFSSANADGAAGSVALKATPTPNSRFTGWSFSTLPVGAKGRGPAHCNPVMRPGTDPPVDKGAAEIQLAFGETSGTSPVGQEGPCGAFTKVPVVYNITATFETDPIVEAGPGDAGVGDVVYEAPQVGATARQLGMTQNGRLWWHFQVSSQSGVAYGTTPSSALIPQTPQIVSQSLDGTISLFEVDPYGVAYQTSLGTISVIPYTTTSPTTIAGAPACAALAVDSSYNVYCRTTSSIVMWQYPSYAVMTPLHTGVPSGTDLVVESASGPMYFSSSNAILSLPVVGADGGTASPVTVIGSRVSPRSLEATSSNFWWLESTTGFYASSDKGAAPSAVNVTPAGGGSGYQFTSADLGSSSSFWVANATSIHRAMNTGTVQLVQDGLQNVGGLAVDSQYVYWTQTSDGLIRRASRPTP